MKFLTICLTVFLSLSTSVFADGQDDHGDNHMDGYQACIIKLNTKVGTAQNDEALGLDTLEKICTSPDRDTLSDCIVDMDTQTSLDSHESVDFCRSHPGADVSHCVAHLSNKTGNAQNDVALTMDQLLSVCTSPDHKRLAHCIINFDSSTSLTAFQSLKACMAGGE